MPSTAFADRVDHVERVFLSVACGVYASLVVAEPRTGYLRAELWWWDDDDDSKWLPAWFWYASGGLLVGAVVANGAEDRAVATAGRYYVACWCWGSVWWRATTRRRPGAAAATWLWVSLLCTGYAALSQVGSPVVGALGGLLFGIALYCAPSSSSATPPPPDDDGATEEEEATPDTPTVRTYLLARHDADK